MLIRNIFYVEDQTANLIQFFLFYLFLIFLEYNWEYFY